MADPIIQLRYNQTSQTLEGTSGSAGFQTLPIASSGSLILTNTHIYVGNGSNLATDVALSGDATMANTGALTIAAGAIVDSKVSASAAIALSKLAALSTNIVPVTNGSGILSSSSTTATELGYVHGVTSAIQTQIGTLSPISTVVSYSATTGSPFNPGAVGSTTVYAITINAALTINGPTGGVDGQKIIFRLTNDASHVATFATGSGNFEFGTTFTSYTATASKTDYLGAIFSSSANLWHLVSLSQGF